MAHKIDLESKRNFSYNSTLKTHNLSVLEFMEIIFGPVLINPVNIEPSIIIENCPHFKIIADFSFTLDSPLVPCIFSNVTVKPTGVLKLFCDHHNLIREYVNNILLRPLTRINRGPEYAVNCNFPISVQADTFVHPILFPLSSSYELYGIFIKGP